MRIGALLGWGIVIYAVIFLAWSGFVLYGFIDGVMPRIAALAILIALALIAGRSLRFHSWRDILPYSIAWTVVAALLDVVFSVPFAGWSLYLDWNVWVGYSMILFVPLFAPLSRHSSHPTTSGTHEY